MREEARGRSPLPPSEDESAIPQLTGFYSSPNSKQEVDGQKDELEGSNQKEDYYNHSQIWDDSEVRSDDEDILEIKSRMKPIKSESLYLF